MNAVPDSFSSLVCSIFEWYPFALHYPQFGQKQSPENEAPPNAGVSSTNGA